MTHPAAPSASAAFSASGHGSSGPSGLPGGAPAVPVGSAARALLDETPDAGGLTPTARDALRTLPPSLAALGHIFARAGHELALVGGPVRDAFLGVVPHDLDCTTSARPEQTERILSAWGDVCWDVGKEFGTIGARKGKTIVEATTYRTEEYEVGSRKPTVAYGDSLEGDLTRRDFTVNAMALRLPDLELVDPFGGLADMRAGVLRTPVSAVQSFDDDTASACPDRAEVPADVPAGVAPRAQDLLGLLRSGRGRAVQIVGHDTQERVTYGSAHEGELVPGANEQVPQGR